MKTKIRERFAILMICDGLVMMFAFVIALLLGHQAPFSFALPTHYFGGLVILILSTYLGIFIADGYSLHKIPERFSNHALILAVGMIISSIVSTFIFFLFREPVPRAVFLIFYVVAFFLIVSLRKTVNKRMLSSLQKRILLVGSGGRSLEVAQYINDNPYLRSVVVGYVSQGDGSQAKGELPRLGSIQDLIPIVVENTIDKVVIAVASRNEELINLLVQCMRRKIELSEFRTVIEEITGKVPVNHLNDNWFLYQLSKLDKRYFWYTKRLADIVIAITGLCLALPLFPFLALLIKLDSRGPIFYTQKRMGRGGVPFKAWKLRTMADGADRNNVHWTTSGDSRITRVGKIVRKTRLDEVPQLINILKGEMTLIGPRPEALSLVEMYTREIPYYAERHMVTPGISGWAQINYPYGNSIEDARHKLMYDFYYIKNRSMFLDLVIFVRTIRTVLTGKGAM